ncbi:MAG TPA: DUF1292 domain-containing protein [Mollicutes bacterium]|nr:DUF1292 domain-containing protein [Mollicutes bacterium]
MEKEIKTTIVVDENGDEFELEIIKEIEHNNKKYTVLYEEDMCECDDDCSCNDEDTCECDEHDGGHIYIFETEQDEDGNDIYNEIDDKTMEELIPIIEKELYLNEE